jgi:hypothetical protein
MPLSRRWDPEFDPAESSLFGIDMSPVLAPGACITSAALSIWTNSAIPADAVAAGGIKAGDVLTEGTIAYARITGGVAGQDYQFRWLITDSDSNTWQRTVLGLCSQTS